MAIDEYSLQTIALIRIHVSASISCTVSDISPKHTCIYQRILPIRISDENQNLIKKNEK